jgi:hypothetical protein
MLKGVKNAVLFAVWFVPVCLSAQVGITPRGSLNIRKEVKPPILSVVEGSVRFVDSNGNNAIDAGEYCNISFDIQNSGMGDATGCVAHVVIQGSSSGISASDVKLPLIPVGAKQHVSLPLNSDMYTVNGQVTLSVSVSEPLGFDIPPFDLAVNTRAFDAPLVKVVDYDLGGTTMLEKNKAFDLKVAVQNVKGGDAEDVKVNLILPDGVYKLDGESMTSISTLDGGVAKYITYKLIVPTAYSSNTVPVKIGLSERYGKYAEGRTIDLALNQQMNKEQIVIEGNIAQGNDNEIQVVAIGSDVDKNIPQSSTTNDNTYVLIIANEHYKNQYVDDVPFAHRD